MYRGNDQFELEKSVCLGDWSKWQEWGDCQFVTVPWLWSYFQFHTIFEIFSRLLIILRRHYLIQYILYTFSKKMDSTQCIDTSASPRINLAHIVVNHHKQCIGRKYRFRTCLNRTHTNYDNIEYICQEGSTTDDDHCHIHMCLVLWTQAPLCAIVLLAFVVGAIWEIRNGIRIKPGSLAT